MDSELRFSLNVIVICCALIVLSVIAISVFGVRV